MIEQGESLRRLIFISRIDNFMKNFRNVFGYLGFAAGSCLFLEPIVFNEMPELFDTVFYSVGASIMSLSLLSLSYKYIRNSFIRFLNRNDENVELGEVLEINTPIIISYKVISPLEQNGGALVYGNSYVIEEYEDNEKKMVS